MAEVELNEKSSNNDCSSLLEREIDVSIIGGGIAGITTAIGAAIEGYNIQVFTGKRADSEDQHKNTSRFATPIGGGNIEPIGINDKGLLNLFERSKIFYQILNEITNHVNSRKFYLWNENGSVSDPPYQDLLTNYNKVKVKEISDLPIKNAIPDGYEVACYNIFGANNSLLNKMYEVAEQIGVKIHKRDLHLPSVTSKSSGVVINCAGLNGPKIHKRPVYEEMTPIKGHLLQVGDIKGDIPGIEYSVGIEKVDNKSINEAYSFTRCSEQGNTKLFLGGSKIEGKWNKEIDMWTFESDLQMCQINRREYPAKILEKHSKIHNRMGIILPTEGENTILTGWRPRRDNGPKYGEVSKYGNCSVIDNYGWGSVGWTLAPGAVPDVIQEIRNLCKPTNRPHKGENIPVTKAMKEVIKQNKIN